MLGEGVSASEVIQFYTERINMKTIYLGEFKNNEDIEKQFYQKIPKDIKILIANYGLGIYEGDAFVLYEQDNKLFEVNGSHCTCYGLEGQWEPEETSIEALRLIIKEGTKYQVSGIKEELTKVLDEYEKEKHASN